jgi:bifunctional NMN adenylyltransferase/nudix hydrolase
MNKIGVIIARFQSPYLHEGHKSIIESVKQKHNTVVVVLGVSPVRGSKRNPLNFHTRERMIKKEYTDIVVLPLSDHPLDKKWSQNLDILLADTFPGSRFILYGSRDSFKSYYSGSNETVDLPENGDHSATTIREQISDKVMDSEEFRTGIIYAYANTYPKVYPTVDIAVFQNERTEILLGRKDIDNKWRLLGGFSDPTDDSFEAAAARELREECGDIVTTPMQYEGSFRVADWRYKNETDKIITTLFSTDYISGIPQGSDDIAEVKWFTLDTVLGMIDSKTIAPEHIRHLSVLLKKYKG